MKNIIGFESCLKKKLDSYMELRESQGYQTSKVRHIFISLDKYLQEAGFNSQSLPPDIIDGWIASLPEELNVNTVNIYISTYIQFAKYLQSSGCSAFIPEKTIGNKNYSPYIFHEDELLALIQAADDMVISGSEKYRHNAACFSVMLRMYIGCGFRLNEVRLLKTKDVDLEYGIIHVRNAKGNRDRLVPMHESLTESVKIYLKSGIPQKENWFFPSETGQPISCSWIRDAFLKYIRYIGIEKPDLPKHSRNICLHCLRHSFAVGAFRQLDSKGLDMYSEVPILSTYMGHENLYGTEHYLHMTTENSQDILAKMEEFNKGMFPEVSE